jgi:hypothetical protein
MKELEKHRGYNKEERVFTSDQLKFFKVARSGNPVPFAKMAMLWEKAGWGKANEDFMRRYYKKLVAEGKIK